MTYFECFEDRTYSERLKSRENVEKFVAWLREHEPELYDRLKDKIDDLMKEARRRCDGSVCAQSD